MTDSALALLFVALLGDIFVWILLYRAISGRLRDRHAERHGATVFGTVKRRKNAMDQFFSVLDFLRRGDHTGIADRPLRMNCALLKMCTAAFFLIFLAMMFGPFFLRLK